MLVRRSMTVTVRCLLLRLWFWAAHLFPRFLFASNSTSAGLCVCVVFVQMHWCDCVHCQQEIIYLSVIGFRSTSLSPPPPPLLPPSPLLLLFHLFHAGTMLISFLSLLLSVSLLLPLFSSFLCRCRAAPLFLFSFVCPSVPPSLCVIRTKWLFRDLFPLFLLLHSDHFLFSSNPLDFLFPSPFLTFFLWLCISCHFYFVEDVFLWSSSEAASHISKKKKKTKPKKTAQAGIVTALLLLAALRAEIQQSKGLLTIDTSVQYTEHTLTVPHRILH